MTTVYLKTNEDGSQSFDINRMAQEMLDALREEWRNRHSRGSELEDEYSEIKSQGSFYSARF